jgi:hypothetical protein
LAASLCFSQTASAETRPLEVPQRLLVIPPSASIAKRVKSGDLVLNLLLRWRSAAVLLQPVQLAADDRRAKLVKGQALVEMRLHFDDAKFTKAAAFCVPRLADPLRKNPLLAMGVIGAALARSTTDGQFCLVDSDRDGVADHSVLVNAGSAAARTPIAITPTPYELISGAPVGEGDSFKIYYGGGNHFVMALIQQGAPRRFETLSFSGPSGRVQFNRFLRALKKTDGSIEVPVPGMTLIGRNYDKRSQSIDVIIPAVRQAVVFPIPDVVRASNGFSY